VADRDRYSVHFRVSGPELDVDALVARARPAGAHEVWRRGELVGEEGHVARTSGLQIEMVDASDDAAVAEAVEAFLDAEAGFLGVVATVAADETPATLSCALWVGGDEPVTLTLPAALLARLGAAGIAVEVTGYPVEDLR
jgi:hypothetical protein